MLPEGRYDGAISCHTSSEGDGTTVRKRFQVYVFLQLACYRIPQRLYPLLERFGISQYLLQQVFLEGHTICQHHHLPQIDRTGDIIIVLSMSIQAEEQCEQDDTVFHVLSYLIFFFSFPSPKHLLHFTSTVPSPSHVTKVYPSLLSFSRSNCTLGCEEEPPQATQTKATMTTIHSTFFIPIKRLCNLATKLAIFLI